MDSSRICFFSENDMSVGAFIPKAKDIIKAYPQWNSFTDVNDIIELYEASLFFDCASLSANFADDIDTYHEHRKELFATIGHFFSNVGEENIEKIISNLDVMYSDVFWKLISEYRAFERISVPFFAKMLETHSAGLVYILYNKKLVDRYGETIKAYLLNNVEYGKLLICEYLEKKGPSHKPLYFPSEITTADKAQIIDNYIQSVGANANILNLIAQSKGSSNFMVSDKQRLAAKERYQKKIDEMFSSSAGISVESCVSFTPLEGNEVQFTANGSSYKFSYDINWIKNNLDYPTLMNNFLFLFDFTDSKLRWNLISRRNHISSIENTIGVHGYKEYPIGSVFTNLNMIALCQMEGYYSILKQNGISIEKIFQWFFQDYLSEEFGAKGFIFNPPSEGANCLEKCRDMVIEMDGILKQFNLFCEDGYVNRHLFEIGTNQMSISDVRSQLENKYFYPIGQDIQGVFNLLYSDQSMMLYKPEWCDNINTAYDLLKERVVNFEDLLPYQQQQVQWLIDKKIFFLDSKRNIVYDNKLLNLLYDLYHNDFSCNSYDAAKYKVQLSFLKNSNMIEYESSLLARPEQDYFDYLFNHSKYDNSLDLRNSYAHGNQSIDEKNIEKNYYQILIAMVLIIIKINEEFCLKHPVPIS